MIRVLDVRTGGEFDSVHIPGSYNVPLDTLAEHALDLAELDHPVVLVCKSGARADQAHGKPAGAGKQRLHLLDGGLDAWLASGGDVVRGASQTWAMDRQVRLVAGSISLVGIVASVVAPKAKVVGRRRCRRADILSGEQHLRDGVTLSAGSRTTRAAAAMSTRS